MQSLTLGYMGHGRMATGSIKLARLVVPVLSTAAGSVFVGLCRVQCTRPFVEAEERLFEAVSHPVLHFDRDGASANSKANAHRQNSLPGHALASDTTCASHRPMLVITALFRTVGMQGSCEPHQYIKTRVFTRAFATTPFQPSLT